MTNKLLRILGKVENTERFLSISLYQGVNKGSVATGLRQHAEEDPTLVCCAFKRQRFYLFTKREPADVDDSSAGRDVFNERPNVEIAAAPAPVASLPSAAVMHTTKGSVA